MDTPRRWQLVTAVTAATGLGLGAMAVGHQPAAPVDAIELTPSQTATPPPPVVDGNPAAGSDAEIVRPRVRSLDGSLASPDDDATPSAGGDGGGSDAGSRDAGSGGGSGSSSGSGGGSSGTSGTGSGSTGTTTTGGTASIDSPDDGADAASERADEPEDEEPESADEPGSVDSAASADED